MFLANRSARSSFSFSQMMPFLSLSKTTVRLPFQIFWKTMSFWEIRLALNTILRLWKPSRSLWSHCQQSCPHSGKRTASGLSLPTDCWAWKRAERGQEMKQKECWCICLPVWPAPSHPLCWLEKWWKHSCGWRPIIVHAVSLPLLFGNILNVSSFQKKFCYREIADVCSKACILNLKGLHAYSMPFPWVMPIQSWHCTSAWTAWRRSGLAKSDLKAFSHSRR